MEQEFGIWMRLCFKVKAKVKRLLQLKHPGMYGQKVLMQTFRSLVVENILLDGLVAPCKVLLTK